MVACAWKDANYILKTHIQLLNLAILNTKSKEKPTITPKGKHIASSSIGIKNTNIKDNPKALKEERNRGRRTNKQLLQELGEFMVNSDASS
jgi:hypothetical protein